MPYWRFQVANFTSAFVWAAVVLAPGTFGMRMLM
jgi:membrane protein DedA with SNARE-associated domain